MKNKFYRHGDLSFHPYQGENGSEIKHKGKFVLAEGETTGHKHVISVPNLDDMEITKLSTGEYVINLNRDGEITHEEHKTIILPKGKYIMRHEREYNYFQLATQQVID
jgi:hypothetical protein